MVSNFIIRVYKKIFARQIFIPLNKGLMKLGLHGLGVLNCNGFETGEHYFINHILPKIKSGKIIVFDIGANHGDYSAMILNKYSQAKIYAFEPHPQNYARLKTRFLDKNLDIQNYACNNKDGYAELYDLSEHGSTLASLNKDVISQIHKQNPLSTQVKTIKLDTFIKNNQINHIDLLKIDVEGQEMEVLKGVQESMTKGIIDIIQFEFNEMNIYTRVFFKDFYDLLCQQYNLFRLLPIGLLPIKYYYPYSCELFAFQNIVAIKKNTNFNKDNFN